MTLPTDVGGVHLRVWDVQHANLLTVIPELSTATVLDERNQPGQLSTTLALSSPGVAVLARRPSALIELYEGTVRVGTYLYDEDDGDDADAAGPDAPLTFTAPGALALLDWAQIYPQAGFGTSQYADFVQKLPGDILLTVLSRAQARGTLDGVNGPQITASFTAAHDSDGTPWPTSIWVRYEAGKTLLDVVNDLTQRGYIDVRMDGLQLDAYVAGGAPDAATSIVPATTRTDAQGWTASSGCTVARNTAILPADAAAVTASIELTAVVGVVATLQTNVTNAQTNLTNAQNTLAADTASINAAAQAANRQLTPAERATLADDQRRVAAAQASYARAQSLLAQAQQAAPTTDMTAYVVGGMPVTGGASYDAGLEVHADAITRVATFSLDCRDSAGQDIGEVVVGSTTDTPSGWGSIGGTVTVPADAATVLLVVRFYNCTPGEKHYAANVAVSPAHATSYAADAGVTLHRPAYVQSGQRRRQRSAVRTALLGLGEANLSLESVDPDAVALYGRREGANSQGGVADYPTLQRLTQLALETQKRPQLGWTVAYNRVTGDPAVPVPQPWRDFTVGQRVKCDWIRWPDVDPLSTSIALVPIRVSSITAQYDASGVLSATVELADVFLDLDVKLQRQITGLLMGQSSADPLGAGNVVPDTTPPNPVSAVYIGSQTFLNNDGTYAAVATINWPGVDTNTDGTPFDDLGWYAVDYRIGNYPDTTGGWQGALTTQNLEVGVGGLQPNTAMQARVLPVDTSGNFPKDANGNPAYAYSATVTLVGDNTGPGTPDAASVTALPGGISVVWDGLDNAGQAMPPDYDYVEVHVSTVSNFTPALATLADTVVGVPPVSTTIVPPKVATGTAYYVRLVAYDSSGNASQPGVQAGPVTPRLLGPADLDPSVLTDTDHSAMLLPDVDYTAGGLVVADAAARDGNARQLANNQTASGVNYTALKPGRYRATFVVRTDVAAATPAPTIGNCNVTGTAVTSDGQTTITTTTVANGQGYRTVSVRFTVTAAANSVSPTLTCTSAAGHLWLSHAYVEPVMSIAVAEIRDAMVADLSATKLTAGSLTADVIAAQDASGNPGRIRVGVVNPSTGLANVAGFSLGQDGLYAQMNGGTRTLLIDANGNVTVTGNITAGSALPGSVYGANLVQNASMEDLALGASAGVAGVLPLTWLDGFAVASGGSAYADRGTVLGGLQSLTVQPNGGDRQVASTAFPVQPGERLNAAAQLRRVTTNGPCYVGLAFGTSSTFGTPAGNTPAPPDNCQLLNLDGSLASNQVGSVGVGLAYVLNGVSPASLGTSYKSAGSVVVPAGATWCRIVLRASGSGTCTFDNVSVVRASDGSTTNSGTFTGGTVQTAGQGQRATITAFTTVATPQGTTAPGLLLYTGSASEQPGHPGYVVASSDTGDSVTGNAALHTTIASPQWGPTGGIAYIALGSDSTGVATVFVNAAQTVFEGHTQWGEAGAEVAFVDVQGNATFRSVHVQILGTDFGDKYILDDTGIYVTASTGTYDLGQTGAGRWNTVWCVNVAGTGTANFGQGYYYTDGSHLAQFAWVTGTPSQTGLGGGGAFHEQRVGGTAVWRIAGNTSVLAGSKTFVVDHPSRGKADRYLVHAAVEGPESAAFYRGTARLSRGHCDVELPPYFADLCDERTATVHLTPLADVHRCGHPDDAGKCYPDEESCNGHTEVANLVASAVRAGRFRVGRAGGFTGGAADRTRFSWLVVAARRDVPPLEAEPSRADYDRAGDGPYTYLVRRDAAGRSRR